MGRLFRGGGWPGARQLAEMIYLWAANGVHTSDYLAAGLVRRDLSFREKDELLMAGP